MIPLALVLAATAPADAAAAHPGSALVCRLQVFQDNQRRIDPKGDFAPFVVRFEEAEPPQTAAQTERFSIYDPHDLLRGAKPLRVHLLRNSVAVTTDVDGPAGILDFNATDYDHAADKDGPVRREQANWFAGVSLIGGPSPYRAAGPCAYRRDASKLDDETLAAPPKAP